MIVVRSSQLLVVIIKVAAAEIVKVAVVSGNYVVEVVVAVEIA